MCGDPAINRTALRTYCVKNYGLMTSCCPTFSEDKATKKTGNTKDTGTCLSFQRRSVNYQKEESGGDRKNSV